MDATPCAPPLTLTEQSLVGDASDRRSEGLSSPGVAGGKTAAASPLRKTPEGDRPEALIRTPPERGLSSKGVIVHATAATDGTLVREETAASPDGHDVEAATPLMMHKRRQLFEKRRQMAVAGPRNREAHSNCGEEVVHAKEEEEPGIPAMVSLGPAVDDQLQRLLDKRRQMVEKWRHRASGIPAGATPRGAHAVAAASSRRYLLPRC